jgi:tRNA (guanine37-N1)-methyltransferase
MSNENDSSKPGSNEDSSTSLINAALSEQFTPLISVHEDPSFVYPESAFPALSKFDISLQHPALIIPARETAYLRRKLKHVLLHRPKMKSVYPLLEGDQTPSDRPITDYRKMVLVNRPNVHDDPSVEALLSSGECCVAKHAISVSYADWTVDEVLRRMLPVTEVPSAFEIIGHLAHLNLREELLPYKYLIGKAVLDKNKACIKTVVNKIGSIANEYRTFGMEVIAGNKEEGWSEVTVKEEGCQYELDFRQVYWNSRLGGEHRRLVDLVRMDAKSRLLDGNTSPLVVADLMAGIGPFAVPLTSKRDGIHMHANDLNPASFKYLEINSKKNRCENLHCYNIDGRAFCHKLQDEGIDFHHVFMNLPATAPEFLDAFRGFTGKTRPRIHVHCFGPKGSESSEQEVIDRSAAALGCKLNIEDDKVLVHMVRNVSPKKNMYCVSFTLPEAVRKLRRISLDENVEPSAEPEQKRTKLE